jgi:hypothetical protein
MDKMLCVRIFGPFVLGSVKFIAQNSHKWQNIVM